MAAASDAGTVIVSPPVVATDSGPSAAPQQGNRMGPAVSADELTECEYHRGCHNEGVARCEEDDCGQYLCDKHLASTAHGCKVPSLLNSDSAESGSDGEDDEPERLGARSRMPPGPSLKRRPRPAGLVLLDSSDPMTAHANLMGPMRNRVIGRPRAKRSQS